jgi:hypothetical protein
VRTTLSAPSFAAFPNVSYAFMRSFIAKRWVTSLPVHNASFKTYRHDVAKHYLGFFIASGREVTDTLVAENASIGNHWGISLRDVKMVPQIVEVVIHTMASPRSWMVGATCSRMRACPDRDRRALFASETESSVFVHPHC